LEEHILHCESCLQLAESITDSDSLITALRSSRPLEEDEELLSQAMERSKLLRSNAETVKPDQTIDIAGLPEDESLTQPDPSPLDIEINFLAPPQEPDEIGRLGDYRVLKTMGVGGMGVVFRAEDPQLKRLVALKVMKPTAAASPSAKARFLLEAQAAAAIVHDNIVAIHQVGDSGEVPFIAMQYLRGESLQAKLERDGRLAQCDVLRIGREVALGLAAAHKQNLIHRDIKPDNIWIEEETSRVKILDFGLARITSGDDSGITQSGMVLGTPRYMAPEQAEGEAVDARCDLFSLGTVLYHLAAGKPPFNGANLTATLIAVAHKQEEPIATLRKDLQPEFCALVRQLLEKDPSQRPQSAAEVAQRLATIEQNLALQPNQIDGHTAARKEPLRSAASAAESSTESVWQRPRTWLAIVGLALIAVLLSAIILRVETPAGTIVLEIDNPDAIGAQVSIDGSKRITINQQGQEPIEVAADERRHSLRISKGGFEAFVTEFSVGKGESKAIRVRLEKKVAATMPAQDAQPPNSVGPTNIAGGIAGQNPLDNLDPADIPQSERFDWQPSELVAVIGEHRGRHWLPSNTRIFDVAMSPDGKTVASADGAGQVHLWHAETLQELDVAEVGLECWSITFSPSGDKLAVASGNYGMITIFAVQGQALKKIAEAQGHAENDHFVRVCAIQFTPDGKSLISAGADKTIRIWDVTGEKPIEKASLTGHTGGLLCLAISKDGKTLASGGDDKAIRLWDLGPNPKLNRALETQTGHVNSIAFSPDGQSLASISGDGELRLWNCSDSSSESEVIANGPSSRHQDVAFGPNGEMLAVVGCRHNGYDSASVFDLTKSGRAVRYFDQHNEFHAVMFAPDGKSLIAGGPSGRVAAFDLTQKLIEEISPPSGHRRQLRHVALSSDMHTLATISRSEVRLWNLTKPLSTSIKLEGAQYAGVFAPDGRHLVTNSPNNKPLYWDMSKTIPTSFMLETQAGTDLDVYAFSPDGATLAHASRKAIQFWDLAQDVPRPSGIVEEVANAIAFSADGKRFVASFRSDNGSLSVWRMKGGLPEDELVVKTWHHPLGFVSDNNQLMTVTYSGHGVYQGVYEWDLNVQPPRSTKWFAARTFVTSAVLSPTQDTVYSALKNGQVMEIQKSGSRTLFDAPGQIEELILSADGRYLFTANSNGTAYILRLDEKD